MLKCWTIVADNVVCLLKLWTHIKIPACWNYICEFICKQKKTHWAASVLSQLIFKPPAGIQFIFACCKSALMCRTCSCTGNVKFICEQIHLKFSTVHIRNVCVLDKWQTNHCLVQPSVMFHFPVCKMSHGHELFNRNQNQNFPYCHLKMVWLHWRRYRCNVLWVSATPTAARVFRYENFDYHAFWADATCKLHNSMCL